MRRSCRLPGAASRPAPTRRKRGANPGCAATRRLVRSCVRQYREARNRSRTGAGRLRRACSSRTTSDDPSFVQQPLSYGWRPAISEPSGTPEQRGSPRPPLRAGAAAELRQGDRGAHPPRSAGSPDDGRAHRTALCSSEEPARGLGRPTCPSFLLLDARSPTGITRRSSRRLGDEDANGARARHWMPFQRTGTSCRA